MNEQTPQSKSWGSWIEYVSGKFGRAVVLRNPPDRDTIDVNADGSTYYGTAPWGSATSSAVWVIERETSNGWVTSAPDQKWDDRLTVVYNNGVA